MTARDGYRGGLPAAQVSPPDRVPSLRIGANSARRRLEVAEAKVALIEAVADLLGQEGRSREDAATAELIRAALDRGARMAGER